MHTLARYTTDKSSMSFCCVVGKKGRTLKPSQHYKPFWVRLYAVASVLLTLTTSQDPDFAKAAATFKTLDGGKAAKEVRSDRKAFCMHWWGHFKEHHDLEDAPRSGRPSKISTEDAKAVAAELKKGRLVKAGGIWGGREVLVGYTSIEEAMRGNDVISSIAVRHKATARDLLRAAHRADPDLGRKHIWSKHKFTDDELASRRAFGQQQLSMLQRTPNYLHLLVFADESSTILHGRTTEGVQVYVSKSNCSFSDICYFSDLALKTIKAHYFLAVTAHKDFNKGNSGGVVVFDFCQGTDDPIIRKDNLIKDGVYADYDVKYKVSCSSAAMSMFPMTSDLMCACGIICCTTVT